MMSLKYAFFVWTYCIMLSDPLIDVITPCGLRLCRVLCETRSTCSLPDYSVETLTCVLRNRELDTGQGGERKCRTLTSIHGQELALCYKGQQGTPKISTAARKVNIVKKPEGDSPIDVSKLKAGTPVVLSNDLYGIFMGKEKVLFIDEHGLQYKDLGDITIRSVMTYEIGKKLRVLHPYQTATLIRMSIELGKKYLFTNKGLVSYCLTLKEYDKAHKLGFKITN